MPDLNLRDSDIVSLPFTFLLILGHPPKASTTAMGLWHEFRIAVACRDAHTSERALLRSQACAGSSSVFQFLQCHGETVSVCWAGNFVRLARERMQKFYRLCSTLFAFAGDIAEAKPTKNSLYIMPLQRRHPGTDNWHDDCCINHQSEPYELT